jgi:peptide/nickel transport system ATP-binding protein
MALIIITHDLGVVVDRTDRVYVFHDGEIVDSGPTKDVVYAPRDAYTKALIRAALLGEGKATERDEKLTKSGVKRNVLLTVEGLTKRFDDKTAVDDVSIHVNERECVAVVGESGSGKTTLARCIIGLTERDSGDVRYSGARTSAFDAQIVFQDPYSSLNPAWTIHSILREALWAAGRPPSEVDELLELAELDSSLLSRKPAQLSGGQRQRVALARALAPRPRLLICDESVSALDVLVQEQILNTLRDLRGKRDLSILLITHDLGVCRRIADRVYVMYDAKVVEEGETEALFREPRHPYTIELLDAAAV